MHESNSTPSGERLTIDVEQDGETLVISPRGELDVSTTQALEVVIREGIDGNASEVILDRVG